MGEKIDKLIKDFAGEKTNFETDLSGIVIKQEPENDGLNSTCQTEKDDQPSAVDDEKYFENLFHLLESSSTAIPIKQEYEKFSDNEKQQSQSAISGNEEFESEQYELTKQQSKVEMDGKIKSRHQRKTKRVQNRIKCLPIQIGKMLKCNWPKCEYQAKHKSSLQIHWLTHTGERPFKCAECGDTFRQSGTLTAHERIHTGERPFRCEECGHAFTQSTALNAHMRMHTGQKPYICADCGNAYTRLHNLKKHRRSAH